MSLINRARGIDKTWVATRALVLIEAQYHIKTKLGMSENHYTNSEESPTHGSGQGAGENIDQLTRNLKDDVTTWDRLLYVTGGLLEWQKCFFYLTIWKFRKDGSTRTLTPEEMGVQLDIDRPDGTSVAITNQTEDSISNWIRMQPKHVFGRSLRITTLRRHRIHQPSQ